MTLAEASSQGYAFYLTDGRLVFRTPYGQPHSLNSEVNVPTWTERCHVHVVNSGVPQQVNGVPVEVVHVTIYSRQSWVVLMVDLVVACSMGQYRSLQQLEISVGSWSNFQSWHLFKR